MKYLERADGADFFFFIYMGGYFTWLEAENIWSGRTVPIFSFLFIWVSGYFTWLEATT